MEIKKQAWDNFLSAVDFESDTNNFKYDFETMTKKYGQAFMVYCKATWKANCGVQTEEEFCKMNANMPIGYFQKVIKNA